MLQVKYERIFVRIADEWSLVHGFSKLIGPRAEHFIPEYFVKYFVVGIKRDKPVLKIPEEIKVLQVGESRHVNISPLHLKLCQLLHRPEDLLRITEHLCPVGIL